MTNSARRPRGAVTVPARALFLTVMAMWMLIPLLIKDNLGQDTIPFVVAGDLVRSQPSEVYASQNGDLFDLRPVYANRFCELSPPDTDCPNVNVAFVSLPQSIPFALALAAVGGDLGVLLMRIAASSCLVGGMLALWSRIAARSSRAPTTLLVTAVLLTPTVMVPLSLAQNSPIMFLAVAIGVGRTDRARSALATGVVWVIATVLKLFPAVLAVILIRQRRWRLLGISGAFMVVLTIASLIIAPASIYGDFLHNSLMLGEKSAGNPRNGSVAALLFAISPELTRGTAANVMLVVEVLAGIGIWWWAARDVDEDVQWAYGWLVALLCVPFLWWHYLWIAVAFIGLAVAARPDINRWLPILPITAALFVPLSVLNARSSSLPVAQALALLVVIGAGGWLIRTSPPQDPARQQEIGSIGVS